MRSDVPAIRTGEETMSEENESNSALSRRTFSKGAIASGAAALGLAGVSGSAAAQQNLNIDADNLVTQNGLLSITIQNTNILDNLDVTVEDIDVTIQNVTVTVVDLIDVGDVSVLTVDIEDALKNLNLNALNTVDVVVNALSDTGQIGGSETVQVVQ